MKKTLLSKAMETSETMEALIELTNSASLSYEDLLHLKRLTEDQLGRNYSLLEYERDHHKNSNQKVIDILEYIDENFNYQRTDRDYDELYHSLDGYRKFLQEKLDKMDTTQNLEEILTSNTEK